MRETILALDQRFHEAYRAACRGDAPPSLRTRFGAARPASSPRGAVAVVPLIGVLESRPSLFTRLFGGTALTEFRASVRALAASSEVGTIVLLVDSPGGSVFGLEETASEVRAARSQKRVIAVADALAASGAFWIAAQADEFVVTPSGEVGSVGVLALHVDVSKRLDREGIHTTLVSAGRYKTEGSELAPLSDEARRWMQGRVDEYFTAMTRDIALGRGVSVQKVLENFGEGRMLGARQALKLGMVDAIEPLDAVLTRLASASPPDRARALSGAARADLDFRRRRQRHLVRVGSPR